MTSAALALPAAAALKGEPARGEKLHEQCLTCHGTTVYLPPARKVKSLRALRREVTRWNVCNSPRLSAQEVEDVVAFLNTNFYRFGR